MVFIRVYLWLKFFLFFCGCSGKGRGGEGEIPRKFAGVGSAVREFEPEGVSGGDVRGLEDLVVA